MHRKQSTPSASAAPPFLHRLGRSSAAHPWRVLAGWLAVVVAAFALSGTVGGQLHDDWNIPGAPAQAGLELLRQHDAGGLGSARVVVHDGGGDPLPGSELTALRDRLDTLPHVTAVSPPRLGDDGDTALLELQYDVPVTDPAAVPALHQLERAVTPTRGEGLQVELGGDLPEWTSSQMRGTGELVGVLVALVVLVLAFGSVVGAGVPLASAAVGLVVGSAGITLLAATQDVSTSAPMVASMVGLGVGIDYALLMVTRFAEQLRGGASRVEAAGTAVATSGRSVLVAASTVLVSLLGLRLAGVPTYDAFGTATGLVVAVVAAASLTVVPALCGLAGPRLLPRAVRRGGTGRPVTDRPPLGARWAARVSRRPLAWALAGVTVLVVIAAPVLDMRTWPQDASSNPTSNTTRRAYDLVAAELGPGANGPFVAVVRGSGPAVAGTVARVRASLEADRGVARVARPVATPDGALTVVAGEPTTAPTDEATADTVRRVRAVLPDRVELTGWTPFLADISALLGTRLWLVIGFVVGVSFLLLVLMFRSVVVPAKAALLNVLSVSGAYGVLTAVFQWGWGSGLLGVEGHAHVSSWMPILMFAILFGLSMDYEVFLLSRVREDYLRTGDPRGSVVRGLGASSRVVTCAAVIMTSVFLGFATESDVLVKQLGLGMAAAIALDATVVRMVLVPATMTLLGHANWWLPGWLDRLLPGSSARPGAHPLRPVAGPAQDSPAASEDGPELVGAGR